MNTLRLDKLNIIALNVNSIISHQRRHNLQVFVNDHNPDVMLLSETRLRHTHKLCYKHYTLIRSDIINNSMVGTAVLIRDNIKHELLNTTPWQLEALETTCILIHTTCRPMCVISLYRSAHTLTHISNDLEILTDICSQNDWDLVIGGDFNAKHPRWNNTTTCTQGRALDAWLIQNRVLRNLTLECTIEPTFRRASTSSFIDFFIISANLVVNRNTYTSHLDLYDYDSDHHAVNLIIRLNSRLHKQEHRFIPNYTNVDWPQFKNQLSSKMTLLDIPTNLNMSPDEIDRKLLEINDSIVNTMSDCIPKARIQNTNNIILPPDVMSLISQKKRMRRRWERIRFRQDGPQLKSEIRLLSKIIDERVRLVHDHYWTATLRNIKCGPSTFKKIKTFTNNNAQNTPKVMINPATNISMSDNIDIANILGETFENVHKQNVNMGSHNFTQLVNQDVATRYDNFDPKYIFTSIFSADSTIFNSNRHLISVSTLKSIIKNRANKKSTGHDGIPNIVLRKLPHTCITKIAILFNQAYNISYFPSTWKHAIVIPIIKKGRPINVPSSYRPISLLPCLGKVYEKALKEVIDRHCEDYDILPDDQFGFRPNRSTTQALVAFKTHIGQKFNQRTPTIACATDIEKAFDTVWQHGVVFKMRHIFGFDDHICKCIHHYLFNRSFSVKIGNSLSQRFNIAAGVPQGGVLSALLYIIFIADIPTPQPNINPIHRLQYADDMIVYVSVKNLTEGQHRLNSYLSELNSYFNKWKIKINAEKCEAIVFKGPNKRFGTTVNKLHRFVNIIVNNTPIIQQKTIKYLGVTFSQNLTHIRHIDNIINKVTNTYFSLKPLLIKLQGLSTRVKMLCYKQLIRPQICYGFPSWSDISSHQMERLRQSERICLRACTNTRRIGTYKYINNSALYSKANINRIDKQLAKQALTFFNSSHTDCRILRNCVDFDPDLMNDVRTYYKPPWYLMHLNNRNELFTGTSLLHYHKRTIRTNDPGLVYNTNQ